MQNEFQYVSVFNLSLRQLSLQQPSLQQDQLPDHQQLPHLQTRSSVVAEVESAHRLSAISYSFIFINFRVFSFPPFIKFP